MTREKAIKMLEYIKHIGNGENEYKNDAQAIAIDMAIQALEQEPKMGHWYRKYAYGNLYCSECNHEYLGLTCIPKFCEECGAKMESEDKE